MPKSKTVTTTKKSKTTPKKISKKKVLSYKKIIEMPLMEGFEFTPKNKNINKITIIDSELINNILSIKFNEKFKKLTKLIMLLLNDDDSSESDLIIALDEAERLKSVLQNKYHKYLIKEKYSIFIKRLNMIESEINFKIISKHSINSLESYIGKGR